MSDSKPPCGASARRSATLAASAALSLAFGCAPAAPPAQAPSSPPAEPAEAAAPAASAGAPTPEPDLLPPSSEAAQEPAPAAAPDTRGKEDIQRVIADHREKVRACYDAALRANPGIQGDLVVSFVINPDGSVKNAEVNWSESEIHVPELDSCAIEVIGALKFPPSSRGLESKVNYPFNFNPGQLTPRKP